MFPRKIEKKINTEPFRNFSNFYISILAVKMIKNTHDRIRLNNGKCTVTTTKISQRPADPLPEKESNQRRTREWLGW